LLSQRSRHTSGRTIIIRVYRVTRPLLEHCSDPSIVLLAFVFLFKQDEMTYFILKKERKINKFPILPQPYLFSNGSPNHTYCLIRPNPPWHVLWTCFMDMFYDFTTDWNSCSKHFSHTYTINYSPCRGVAPINSFSKKCLYTSKQNKIDRDKASLLFKNKRRLSKYHYFSDAYKWTFTWISVTK